MNKISIMIGECLDGFLGNDPEEIEKIDVDASIKEYEDMVSKRIREMHPYIDEVVFGWDEYAKNDLNQIENEEERDWLLEDIGYIEELVYNSQEFWVLK